MDAKDRFSSRVNNYILYRPSYPAEFILFLQSEGLLKSSAVVADIGSGTGLSSLPFLDRGYEVIGVEPNREMREAAERLLSGYPSFRSVDASAENTGLPDASVDLIVAGQAFHWFDKSKARDEFRRIMKAGGSVVLMWNDRRTNSSPFLVAYEELLKKFGTDYEEVNHKNIDGKIFREFFCAGDYKEEAFDNFQYFDLAGLKGRVLSSSYMPAEGQRGYEEMMSALEDIFREFELDGKVRIEYDTRLYFGRPA